MVTIHDLKARHRGHPFVHGGVVQARPWLESNRSVSNFDCEKGYNNAFNLNPCLSELAPLQHGAGWPADGVAGARGSGERGGGGGAPGGGVASRSTVLHK